MVSFIQPVKVALQIVTVVVEDTDVLVLLVHHYQESRGDIYMMSTGGLKKGPRYVKIQSVQNDIGICAMVQLLYDLGKSQSLPKDV